MEGQQCILLDELQKPSSSVRVPGTANLQHFFALYLLPRSQVGGSKICGIYSSEAKPDGLICFSFCVNCLVTLIVTLMLGLLLESPGVLLEMFRKPSSKD